MKEVKEEKEEEVVEESWRRWRCDGRGKICLVDMAHSGKYSQLDKAGKGGRNEGAADKLDTGGEGGGSQNCQKIRRVMYYFPSIWFALVG